MRLLKNPVEAFTRRLIHPLLPGLVAVALGLSALPAGAQMGPIDPLQIPGVKRSQALAYPDKTAISVNASGFQYVVVIDGEHQSNDGHTHKSIKAQVRVEFLHSRGAHGLWREEKVQGSLVSRQARDGKVESSTTDFDYNNQIRSTHPAEGQKPIFISKQRGIAHFAAPLWHLNGFPTITTYQIPGEGEQTTMKDEAEARLDIRIPNLAATTNTPFALLVREIETQGHEARMPLLGRGVPPEIEIPWKGAVDSGSFTIPIAALVSSRWIEINTPAAVKYLQSLGGSTEQEEIGMKRFPGTLTIHWWLGPRPQK
jgi:hypothetical protein